MVVQLSILVGNAADLIGLGYTHVEVHQSVDQGNSFQEVTAATARAAILDSSPALTTFQMGGKLLKLVVDGGAERVIYFGSVLTYWSPAQVAARINEVVAGLATVIDGTTVRLTSPTTGRASSIKVTYCDAYDLGWVADQIEYGRAARISLSSGTLVYSFPDVAGRNDDRYKWRFSAAGASPISDFSAVVQGQVQPTVSSANLSVGTAKFLDVMGRPLKARILVATLSVPQSLGGMYVSGPQPLQVDSDATGFLQLTLMRGARVRVAIEDSAYVREFVVPDAASFDILATMASAPDQFTVQTTPPLLIRRSI